ncbi:hypothetical protein L6R46_22710 [Myxococcota bacterium]|nr:hypothetical protein [Myxococcota bacterium]
MKRIVTAFGQKTYISATGGTTTYQHELGIADVLGQAKSLRVHVIGSRQSTAYARATLRFYESSKPGDARPQQWGVQIGTGTGITTLRPAPFTIVGPFMARVECVLEIDDSVGQDDPQEFDLEVHITAIMEE